MNVDLDRKHLVEALKDQGYIQSTDVETAMDSVPREAFIPKKKESVAYVDKPLDIGSGQTISAPHMVAIMTEAMDLSIGQKVLEIGTGSGYHAAVVASVIGNEGIVYSVERFPQLASNAQKRLKDAGIDNVTVVVSDGSKGLPEFAPYDRIYVTCSSPNVPDPLKQQVKENGKIVIPVGRVLSDLQVLTKKKDKFSYVSKGGCAFVPLIGKYGFEK
jgi:protein-L-isoaspartate(D-aspartate) O-methyltransferase